MAEGVTMKKLGPFWKPLNKREGRTPPMDPKWHCVMCAYSAGDRTQCRGCRNASHFKAAWHADLPHH